jgi:hypothetical protein
VQVEWGEASMLQAERLLLEEALRDPLNQRFILLSDSCVPLYSFRYIYDYVMFCQKSFVDRYCTNHVLNMFTFQVLKFQPADSSSMSLIYYRIF